MNSQLSDIQFSVIIPLYNKGPHIHRSIQSVLNQTYPYFELLVVDDGSTDNSLEVVSKFTDDRIHVLKRNKPGPGGYAARNHGAKNAKNAWLAFLDADDEWMPDHLERMVSLIQKHKEHHVFGSGWQIKDPDQGDSITDDSFFDARANLGNQVLNFEDYLSAEIDGLRPICSSVAVIGKNTFLNSGGFPEGKVRRGGDVDTWLRCIELSNGIVWSSHRGAIYYRDSMNMVTRSENLLATAERETVARFTKKYHGKTNKLLKQFANKRTLSAWKQSLTSPGHKILLYNKLYLDARSVRLLLIIIASFLPKDFVIKLKAFTQSLLFKKFKVFILRLKNFSFIDQLSFRKKNYCLGESNRNTFFGYHDKTPFSLNNEMILAMSTLESGTSPDTECTPIQIGYFQKDSSGTFLNKFIPISETTTWCWQQGSMLQWNPTNANQEIIFNKMVNGKYGSAIVDLNGTVIKEFTTPIYSISPDGKYAVSLNFSRLGRLRPGYGYKTIPDETINELAPKDDGLLLLNIEKCTTSLLISLEELAKFFNTQSDINYVNHATFSPSGKYISFFHIFIRNGKRNINFCSIDLNSKELNLIEAERTVSHYCWRNDFEILATTKDKNKKWRYCFYDLSKKDRTDLNIYREDGHPMFHPKKRNIFVTDTYPDNKRDQILKVFDLERNKELIMTNLYSPLQYDGQVRCDLHPRWDRNGEFVAVDSTINGSRKIILQAI